jgi:hypothetical protein
MFPYWISSAIWLLLGVLFGVAIMANGKVRKIHERFKKGKEEIDIDEKEESD